VTEAQYPRPYGSYTLLERLGAGGMSEVDLARRTVGESGFVRFLVIKRIRASNQVDEQYVRMFQDEARINAELSHENIAQVYDFGREGEEFYMAMEYVPGLDLRAVQIALAKQGKLLPVRIALTILCGVLRALQYAHGRVDQLGRPMNIVHRDVNPRNIMLSVNGEVKLIDFGVAKAADRLERTEGNTVKGKFAYMAPEQIEANSAVDGRADLYAVALVLHELMTGRSPFAGLTEVQIMHRILSAKIPPLPEGIDHPDLAMLQRIHSRGLAIRPDERYRTADEMRADLERALAPIGGPAPAIWIAELLREAAGDGVSDITRRLRAYREGAATSPRLVIPAPPSEASGTLNVANIEAPPGRPAWIAWAAAGAGLSGGLILALLLGGGAVVGWFYLQDSESDAVAAPTAPLPADLAPPQAAGLPGASDASTPSAAVMGPGTSPPGPGAAPGPALRPPAPPDARTAAPQPASTTTNGPLSDKADKGGVASAGAAGSDAGTQPVPEGPPVAVAAVTPPRTEPTPPPATSPPPPSPPAASAQAPKAAEGFLNLTSRPLKLDVYLDGAKIGVTPLRLFRVPSGAHEIAVRDPVTGRSDTRSIQVVPEEVLTLPPVILE
jgi:hypothetical protein